MNMNISSIAYMLVQKELEVYKRRLAEIIYIEPDVDKYYRMITRSMYIAYGSILISLLIIWRYNAYEKNTAIGKLKRKYRKHFFKSMKKTRPHDDDEIEVASLKLDLDAASITSSVIEFTDLDDLNEVADLYARFCARVEYDTRHEFFPDCRAFQRLLRARNLTLDF